MKSWKTTLAGIGTILVPLGAALTAQFDGDPNTVANWGLVVTVAIGAIGLMLARDNDVSSEQAGAK